MEEFKVVKRKIEHIDKPMTFIDHLDKLRSHLIRGILAILIVSVVAFFFKDFLFNEVVLKPKSSDFITTKFFCELGKKLHSPDLCMNQTSFNIINIDLAGQFKAHFFISLLVGLVVAFPYLAWELWRFIKPALKQKELKSISGIVVYVSVLFSIGMLFGYFVMLPIVFSFFGSYIASSQIINQINFSSYFSNLTSLTLGSGLVFEIPIVAYFLAKIGIINYNMIKKYRKHAIVVSFVIGAIVTPPDAFSMFVMAIPIYLLYEVSALIVRRISKKRVVQL